jgi:hypothetical protein
MGEMQCGVVLLDDCRAHMKCDACDWMGGWQLTFPEERLGEERDCLKIESAKATQDSGEDSEVVCC